MKIKFGTDGWRGIIGEDFTFSNLRVVSQAIADFLKKEKGKKVVVGYDARFLSYEFALENSLVLAANNIKVDLSSTIVPTPLVSFAACYGNYDLGVMITASHNPSKFNGLKIKTKEGAAADKSLTGKIESFLGKSKVRILSKSEAKRKKLLDEKDFTKNYKEFLKKFVDLKRIRKLKLRILLDLMYGAGNSFVEEILKPSGIKIDYLHQEYNPSFGGLHPEPVEENLKDLIKKVKKEGYDFGVALDGDGDRIALVTKEGRFISAQVILPLLAMHMIKNRGESLGIGKTVVGSNLIDEVACFLGVSCFETPVGFKYISNLFKQNLISIGGEEAGGIGFRGYIPERDGNASFLMVLEMIAWEKKSLEELIKNLERKFGRWYYSRIAVDVRNLKKNLKNIKLPQRLLGERIERINKMDGLKMITKNSWLMLRKSGTEPIVRIYAEAREKKHTQALLRLGRKMLYAL